MLSEKERTTTGMRKLTVLELFILISIILMTPSFSFILRPSPPYSHRYRVLNGLLEWRDQQAHYSESSMQNAKSLLLLPFSADEALVQGQCKEIVLKDGRFFDLFQDSIDDHESIVGMVLMGEDGMLNEFPLCEIHDFEVKMGFKGKLTVDVTLRAVGRARLNELIQMKPIMIGRCSELADDEDTVTHEAMVYANEVVDSIERIIGELKTRGENNQHLGVAYNEAYDEALQVHRLSLGSRIKIKTSSTDELKRPFEELVAASWAVFAAVSDKSCVVRALQLTNFMDRLQFGLKMILEDKYLVKSEPVVFGNFGEGCFE